MLDNIVKVYNKNMELLAIFTGDADGAGEDAMRDMLVAPTVKLQSGELATLSFQMLADSQKWKQINHPENLFHLNDRWFTPLAESSFSYDDSNGVSVVNVTLVEIGALLSRQYHQCYNCGIYCYARATFNRFVNDGAEFIIHSSGCSNIGNTVSNANAWAQIKNWTTKDDNGNNLTYAILSQDEYKPTKWEKFPSGVFFKSFSVAGNTATVVIESRAKINVSKTFEHTASNQYNIGETPLPSTVKSVSINSTVTTTSGTTVTYTTSDKPVTNFYYNSSTGIITVNYYPGANEKINGVTVTYQKNDLGTISPGATCTFAYGAEAVDEHTFIVLPKAKTKYKLTIDQTQYNDSEVRDSRGAVMPRGSGGYAMWAALRGTGWTLGVCDVIAKEFNADIDYGCFNIESDMKDTLSNIRMIQKLYGGILDWDSEHKVLNYRAENYDHYQAYMDGFNEWKGYVFREGKNMTERPVITYDNSIITRAYLLGYGNLNVRKVNNGKTYVDNFSYTNSIYEGYLKQELIYDTRDDGGMKQLLYWGQKELEKQCRPRKNVKLSVTDVRTVEGLEHEVFDINDIVKVYYHDESTDTDVTEYQRVVSWEYNAFAMWDCEVELGDKTVNEVELFKLIYNKSLTTPGTDGSGNISGGNVNVGGGIGGGGGGGEFYDPNSLQSHIELIARTTTDNSDAIAGLILDTSAVHAQVDLFAMYQKQTDTLLTETYAGLQFYADEKKAEAITAAEFYSENRLKEEIKSTKAYVKQYADAEGARVEAIAQGYWEDSNKKIGSLAGSITEIKENYATKLSFTNYQQNVNGQISSAKTAIMQYADAKMASITLTAAQYTDGWTGQNGIRFTIGHDKVTIGNVQYPAEAFDSEEIPLTNFVPQYIIDSANITFNLNKQINGDSWSDGMAKVVDEMKGWRYYGSTTIDGSKIETGTIKATILKGGAISLLDESGSDSGTIYVRDAYSSYGNAVAFEVPAMAINATNGTVWINSQHGAVELHSESRYVSISAYTQILANKQISTNSDKSLKKEINYDMSEYIKLFDKLKPCSYKMIDSSNGRTHIGMIANDVEEALEECGIGTKRFAGFVKEQDKESKNYGIRSLRYGEFIGLCIAKIQEQDREINEIKKMLKQ